MKKICFLFVCMLSIVPAAINAQPRMQQAPYYDALAFYYALHNYTAYALVSPYDPALAAADNTGATGATGSNPNAPVIGGGNNPLFPSGATGATGTTGTTGSNGNNNSVRFQLIESLTGKILAENLTKSELEAKLALYTNATEAATIKKTIFARNAGISDTSDATLEALYKNNTFINDTSLSILSKAALTYPGFDTFNKTGGGAPSFQGMLINGFTDYLIAQVNNEINDAFFIHLRNALEKSPELKILFPKTMESLQRIDISSYSQSITTIKTAYQEDITALLSNIKQLATLKRYQYLIHKYPELTMVFAACDILDLVKQGDNAADILYQVSTREYLKDSNNYSSFIKMACLASNSFRDIRIGNETESKQEWIDDAKVKVLATSPDVFRIFMGFFSQRAKGIYFKFNTNSFAFQERLFATSGDILKTQYILLNFRAQVNRFAAALATFNAGLSGSAAPTTISGKVDIYLNFAKELTGFVQTAISPLPYREVAKVSAVIDTIRNAYFPMLYRANAVVAKIEAKEYTMAVYEADTLLQMILAKREQWLASVKDTTSSSDKKPYTDSISNLQNARLGFLKYGTFIASVASAKSEADVKDAISAFALPTGSSRIKKTYPWTVGLNAYAGVYYAHNKTYPGLPIPSTEWGITAPLGVSVNKRVGNAALSVFGGIIDVGAIFTYKINSDSTASSDVQFSQILSPSAGLVFSFPLINGYNVPLAIGANVQWGPKLKAIKEEGNSLLPALTPRFNIFLAFDIPVLNFYVARKKYD